MQGNVQYFFSRVTSKTKIVTSCNSNIKKKIYSQFKRVDLSESSKYFIEMALVIDRSVSNDFWRRGRLIQNHYKDIINVVNAVSFHHIIISLHMDVRE